MSPRTDAATGEDFGWEGEATGLARPVDASQLDTRHGDILYLDDITVSFDGFRALNKLTLDIAVGELRCIIGPNGAGKTTMMDVITGKTRPDAGTAFFGQTIDLTRLNEPTIAQIGIGRKFQKPTVFEAMTVAENLGCTPDHIFFTSGGSESNTWAIRGTVPQGGHVVTTPIEHHSVLNACASIRDDGGRMTTLEVDGFGRVVPESLTRALAAHPNLVSLQYANNEVGVVQNIPALAALCREADVLLHVDAVQAAGHLAIPLDGIDFLSASAHKFGGPKGIGFLYVREPRKLRPLIYGGSQQYGLCPGTEPAALIAGLAAAFKVTCAERRQRTAKKRALAEEFWQTLHAARPEARLHTPADGLPGLLSVGLPGRSGQRLTYQLDVAGVSVSPGAACDNRGVQEPSHVLMALGGTAAEDALSTLRFSFGSANRPGDGKEAAERLIKILEQQ